MSSEAASTTSGTEDVAENLSTGSNPTDDSDESKAPNDHADRPAAVAGRKESKPSRGGSVGAGGSSTVVLTAVDLAGDAPRSRQDAAVGASGEQSPSSSQRPGAIEGFEGREPEDGDGDGDGKDNDDDDADDDPRFGPQHLSEYLSQLKDSQREALSRFYHGAVDAPCQKIALCEQELEEQLSDFVSLGPWALASSWFPPVGRDRVESSLEMLLGSDEGCSTGDF
uniref:Uncharacterized protein n=1 Tax=Odontella aurita TaxID=265563 RepID=A0A7S4MFM1_9STRA|mmetsp:Transcript_20323/g.58752  ORF Transcript_20323/g.58752 Transcript_20323/m.58752 type:complete len:225 (+) Transcript_20323:132-806(+)|eukprot:CAMPEP_0113527974 /NCGR_PEP_ID=MMETSP0015_2-20120614/1586_1 /TAXON_ID=2838 /ORGANISM="Odontella" /LENGTH=224 /DNA_ID=CAMNT_0000426453 /DNA_START=63 /DNA_END=737 /DNA_ORIENTATION=- /assembly_acc=CAM_ASM_000160